jgi:Mn-dependent DtxR family transcriptional regulator
MAEQLGQYLKAIYAVQNEIGRARVLDIASHLGLDHQLKSGALSLP